MSSFRYLTELDDNPHRMGRHQVHDLLVPEKAAKPRAGVRLVDPFDQGDIGDCTANALVGCLMTPPLHRPGWNFTEATCVEVYKLETTLDNSQIPGSYPPVDTGSTGPWSMIAAKKNGWISDWKHTRSLHTALALLVDKPISLGVPWYKSMFTPDQDGVLTVDESSGLAGGHQLEVSGLDVDGQRVRIANSWGTGWGLDGYCWLPWSALELLLHLGGDVCQAIL